MLSTNTSGVQNPPHSLQEKIENHLSFLLQDPENLNLLLEISNLYSELDDLAQAQSYLNKAKLLRPELCLGAQGLLNLKQGEIQKAKENFQEAIEHHNTPELQFNLAFTYYIDQDFENAWTILSSIKESDYLLEIQLLMARILQQQNELEKAINLLEAQIQQNPHDAEAISFLSLLYFDNNNESSAAEFSQRALALNSELYDAQLVNVMLRLLNQETTIDEIEALLKVNPQDSRLWFALGSTYMGQGDFSSAEEHLEKTLEIHPEFYDCHIALAWCQLLNNKPEQAHITYQNAISIVDYIADGWGGLAIIYALNADLEQTEQLIIKAQSLNSDCFLTQIAQTIYLTHKNPQQAQQHLFTSLSNQELVVSEKLALIINEL